MPTPARQTQRIRDPIHGLIVFDGDDPVDMMAWDLINTPEFQRLRRIRQLGVSEFVFPGATHTRFAHSIGVYHNARRLLRVLESRPTSYDRYEAKVARLAALLHDVGHGPFSHAFESARSMLAASQTTADGIKNHEEFSARLIEAENSAIRAILVQDDEDCRKDLPGQIGSLLRADAPGSIYHAVVSSSFDADRLDYLQRDRFMTGTGAGAIDLEWLLDNLDTFDIPVDEEGEEPDGSAPRTTVPTFIFKEKARPAAEDFLLARYRLYSTVYMHKTTRGFEKIIATLVRWLGTAENAESSSIESDHPLIRFLRADDEALDDYRRLDDQMLWGLVDRLARSGPDEIAPLCRRLLERQPLRCLDLSRHFGSDTAMIADTERKLREAFDDRLDQTVFADDAGVALYSQGGGDDSMSHKRIRIRRNSAVSEITRFEDTIIGSSLRRKTPILRFYFLNEPDHEAARRIMEGR